MPMAEPPNVGDLVFDSEARKVGEVRDSDRKHDRFWLRPPGGGIEWIASLNNLSPSDNSPTQQGL